jgi:site-specific DNA-methyltransferase (adenine-specific)
MRIGNGTFLLGDCFEQMRSIPDGSVDMVLCDLPYGTTACSWDIVLPFDQLWAEYWRVCKPNAAVVLTASQPFTSALVMSQPKAFRHSWFWVKEKPGNFQRAKLQPAKYSEDVVVFSRAQVLYNPQNLIEINKVRKNNTTKSGSMRHLKKYIGEYNQQYTNYPSEFIFINNEKGLHESQKPVALFEYLIRTYTNPGELVLDNTAGSGTTAIAAENSGRLWLCIERDEGYYAKATARVQAHVDADPLS